jgi:hypothetical protein
MPGYTGRHPDHFSGLPDSGSAAENLLKIFLQSHIENFHQILIENILPDVKKLHPASVTGGDRQSLIFLTKTGSTTGSLPDILRNNYSLPVKR